MILWRKNSKAFAIFENITIILLEILINHFVTVEPTEINCKSQFISIVICGLLKINNIPKIHTLFFENQSEVLIDFFKPFFLKQIIVYSF